jgi:murein DD-endopeptidase MepM/ murein hydrolase activator NlpD
MENKPLQEFPRQKGVERPGLLSRWMARLAHLGGARLSIRIGTNILAIFVVVAVVWLLQQAKLGRASSLPIPTLSSPQPIVPVTQIPVKVAYALDGIPRQADLHTTIPSRPRQDVVEYTVEAGDSIFVIADKFGLRPTTILFGNYETLKDSPDLLKVGQKLKILPVDGTYYQWQGTENLVKVAEVFGVDPETIINYPGNHLDPEAVGDLNNPNIPAYTWLIVPGGRREFTSWTAPAQLVRSNPSVHVWGQGVCTGISYVQVGYGTFIYPTVEHWLSGTPFLPEIKHFAVDFAGSLGNAIYATDAGTVVYAGWNDYGYGNLIILDHGNGWESRYAHLSQINVSCGQNVGQGDVIGLMGSTGNSTGPHLHFELMNSTLGKVNPLDFLPAP